MGFTFGIIAFTMALSTNNDVKELKKDLMI